MRARMRFVLAAATTAVLAHGIYVATLGLQGATTDVGGSR
jgi:hypothetical protein